MPFMHEDSSLSSVEFGHWQTTVRLLCSLINDGLLATTAASHPSAPGLQGLLLHGKKPTPDAAALWIGLTRPGLRHLTSTDKQILTFPGDFVDPIFLTTYGAQANDRRELDPPKVMSHVRSVLDVEAVQDDLWDQVCAELTSSANNQRYWYEWAEKKPQLSIQSTQMDWEQACYTGHPLHPMHRSVYSEAPLPKINPENVSSLMKHSISFVEVPGSDVRISGKFRTIVKELLIQFGIPPPGPQRVILPCIDMQIPVLQHYHPDLKVVRRNVFYADTQSSMRTCSVPFLDYDLKFALDVKIGSALRTITPWTGCIVAELSDVLREILPSSCWLMDDSAAVTGSGDFNRAKHITCIMRKNLRREAAAADETFVVAGALQEVPPHSTECNAALAYNLKTPEQKMAWFTEYTVGVMDNFMAPVIDYGCAFEAHAQNVVVRCDRQTGAIKGFATRDLGSIKMHMPTLAKSGYELHSALEGSFVAEQDIEAMWRIIQFCLFQNNLNTFIYRLGLDRNEAWAMIRQKLCDLLDSRAGVDNVDRLRDFLFAETVPQKAFMVMKFNQAARTYQYVDVPNVLREGLDKFPLPAKKPAATAAAAPQQNGVAHANGHVEKVVASSTSEAFQAEKLNGEMVAAA